jgi:hypothetical protein
VGTCESQYISPFIGLIVDLSNQTSTDFSNSKFSRFYRILSVSKFDKVTQNSAVLQNDPEEILTAVILDISFEQKEAPSITGVFFFNPNITKESKWYISRNSSSHKFSRLSCISRYSDFLEIL